MEVSSLQDDVSVDNGTLLFRRILVQPKVWIIWDEIRNAWRPTSAAFDNDRYGKPTSVVLEDTLRAAGREVHEALAGHSDMALAAVSAGDVRAHGLGVVRDPTPEEPAHGLITGKKTRKVRQDLAISSKWILEPQLLRPPA